MKFYNVKTREAVEVPDDQVTVVTMKNGKKAAQTIVDGTKLFRIIGKEDAARLAAIMEELRSREGITETRVAFGGVDNQIESADYAITYAAEAIAYQRAQKYSSVGQLRSSSGVLRGKILKAKNEVGKALNE